MRFAQEQDVVSASETSEATAEAEVASEAGRTEVVAEVEAVVDGESDASRDATGRPSSLWVAQRVSEMKRNRDRRNGDDRDDRILDDRCHPRCRWQCDEPDCPARCLPVCTLPVCQVKCQQGPCADCNIRCHEPDCTVRCPKDVCKKGDCPKCETVCAPAKCHTECEPPTPLCVPVCATTQCKLECKKPNNCPRPKCQLVCEKVNCSVGQSPWSRHATSECCPCTQATLRLAILRADAQRFGEQLDKIHKLEDEIKLRKVRREHWQPSLLELLHTVQHDEKRGLNGMCCPCTKTPMPRNKEKKVASKFLD